MILKKKKSSKMKIIILLFLITPSTTKILNEITNDIKSIINPPKKRTCNKKLYESFGLEGSNKVLDHKLVMCPFIKKSCCLVSDQIQIYKNWFIDKENFFITKRFEYYEDLYSDLIDYSIKVNKRAKKTFDFLWNKKNANCRILAKRMLVFQIKTLGPKLKEAIRQMYEYLHTSYKGFYCNLCDAEKQKFFDLRKKKFYFGQDFCRGIVTNSLHVLLYLHVHLNKYLNLAAKFMNSCDFKGRFIDVKIPFYQVFKTKSVIFKNLNNCKKFRNDMSWFKNCFKICKKYSPTKIDLFFRPNVRKISGFNRFLKLRLKKINLAEKLNIAMFAKKIPGLKKKKKGKKKIIKKSLGKLPLWKEYVRPDILRSALNDRIGIMTFKSDFNKKKALNLYFVGKTSNFDDQEYKFLLEDRMKRNLVGFKESSVGGGVRKFGVVFFVLICSLIF